MNITKKNQKTMDYEKITIWDKTQPSPVNNKKTTKKKETKVVAPVTRSTSEPEKRKARLGFRHSIYALILGVLIQFALAIPLLINSASTLVSQNTELTTEGISQSLLSGPVIFWSQMLMYVAWFSVGLYVTFKLGLHSFVKDFWLKFRWARDIGFGILIAIGLRLAEMGVLWALGALGVNLAGADNSSSFTTGTGFWLYAVLIIGVSIVGPFSEEFLFRGMMLQGLLKTFGKKTLFPRTWFGEGVQATSPAIFNAFIGFKNFLYKHKNVLAVIISSTAFGFMHLQGFDQFGYWLVVIITGLIGAVFALIVLKTKRLGMAIVAHMVFNFSAVLLVLLNVQ